MAHWPLVSRGGSSVTNLAACDSAPAAAGLRRHPIFDWVPGASLAPAPPQRGRVAPWTVDRKTLWRILSTASRTRLARGPGVLVVPSQALDLFVDSQLGTQAGVSYGRTYD